MAGDVITIVMRVLHIVSAIVAIGGLTFALACLLPALRGVDNQSAPLIGQGAERRFMRLLWMAIGGLVVSGIYNWLQNASIYKDIGPIANALIGVKVLLALVIFTVVGLRSAGLIKSQKAALMINIHLAIVVIILAAVLRYLRLEHLQAATGAG